MTRRPSTRRDPRKAALAAVHAGRKQLGWDDEAYRAVVAQVARGARDASAPAVTSASELTLEELGALIDVMRGRGYGRAPGDARPTYAQTSAAEGGRPQLALIRALWAELEQLGETHVPGEAGLRAWARKRYGVAALEWVTPAQASDVIEALKAMQRRAVRASAEPAP